jgi:hypothetical protein
MPTQTDRPSLSTDLVTRYEKQPAGGAFDVKKTLKAPGQTLQSGDRLPIDGNEKFFSVDDFAAKQLLGVTEFLDAAEANTSASPRSVGISRYVRGFSNQKYKP